jgi:hypothetical protein
MCTYYLIILAQKSNFQPKKSHLIFLSIQPGVLWDRKLSPNIQNIFEFGQSLTLVCASKMAIFDVLENARKLVDIRFLLPKISPIGGHFEFGRFP